MLGADKGFVSRLAFQTPFERKVGHVAEAPFTCGLQQMALTAWR